MMNCGQLFICDMHFQALHVTNNMSEAAKQAQEEAEIKVSVSVNSVC